MFFTKKQKPEIKPSHSDNIYQSLKKHVAWIEFTPEGVIQDASAPFLTLVGYSLDEIKGQHHKIFCTDSYVRSSPYQSFWRDLANGISKEGTFERVNKQGDTVVLEATYLPIKDSDGRVTGVAKLASDITEINDQNKKNDALFSALDKSQAIIEFDPEGTILTANSNFLNTLGYRENQVVGKHHRMFCFEEFYSNNPHFWQELQKGQLKSGLFQRRSSNGSSIWIEASYNPIMNEAGKVVKIVKLASNITDRIERSHAIAEASEVAYSTSLETAQIALEGSKLLADSVEPHYVGDVNDFNSIIYTVKLIPLF